MMLWCASCLLICRWCGPGAVPPAAAALLVLLSCWPISSQPSYHFSVHAVDSPCVIVFGQVKTRRCVCGSHPSGCASLVLFKLFLANFILPNTVLCSARLGLTMAFAAIVLQLLLPLQTVTEIPCHVSPSALSWVHMASCLSAWSTPSIRG